MSNTDTGRLASALPLEATRITASIRFKLSFKLSRHSTRTPHFLRLDLHSPNLGLDHPEDAARQASNKVSIPCTKLQTAPGRPLRKSCCSNPPWASPAGCQTAAPRVYCARCASICEHCPACSSWKTPCGAARDWSPGCACGWWRGLSGGGRSRPARYSPTLTPSTAPPGLAARGSRKGTPAPQPVSSAASKPATPGPRRREASRGSRASPC
jgi:hypothetical protein